MSNYSIDLNCDMGESFGAFQKGQDEAIMPLITSANIACGFHAGDPKVMKQTVKLAMQHNVAIGAHPGLPDLQGFGRRNMAISAEEAYDMVIYQIGALDAFVKSAGGSLHHVKPHGALYNLAAVDMDLAEAIAQAVFDVSPNLILYGLAGSEMITAARRIGLPAFREAFADRTYLPNGTLSPRHLPGALIVDPAVAVMQVVQMIAEESADTICIHGDGLLAVEFARAIHEELIAKKITIQPPTKQT